MRVGTVCSGIGAPEVAAEGLGWSFSFASEIDAFPRAVLQQRHPDIPLHGDFTTIEDGDYEPIDLLIGGTPCQSFSVAGLREGLSDERGNLALEYIFLADRLRPRWLAWENVPGVLSSRPGDPPEEDDGDPDGGPLLGHNGGPALDAEQFPNGHDFACLLSGFVRWEVPIPEGGWKTGGIVAPAPVDGAYGVAWRVLDAQYAGVPQRRRRLFVVGYIGDWRRAAAVLFERHSLSGDSPPRRQAGSVVASALTRGLENGGPDDTKAQANHIVAGTLTGGARREGGYSYDDVPLAVAGTIDASLGASRGAGTNPGTLIPLGMGPDGELANALNACETASGRHDASVETFVGHAVPILESGKRTGSSSSDRKAGDGIGNPGDPMFTLGTDSRHAVAFHSREDPVSSTEVFGALSSAEPQAQAICFDTTQITVPTNRSNPKPGDPSHTLSAQAKPPAIAFTSKDYGQDAGEELSPTLRGMGHDGSHANGGGQVAVAYPITNDALRGAGAALTPSADAEGRVRLRNPGLGVGDDGDPAGTMVSAGPGAVAFAVRGRDEGAVPEIHEDGQTVGTLRAANGGSSRDFVASVQVRRLTPLECERLQGFRDHYTAIKYRGGPAKDGPRYKALGNSMAVPVIRWLFDRIAYVDALEAT